MGVLYIPTPLNNEQFADEEWADWLRQSGIESPPVGQQSHWPTVAELRQALDTIDDCDVRYSERDSSGGDLLINVEVSAAERFPAGLRSPIQIHDVYGDVNKAVRFHFEKGALESHLIIMKNLSRRCGPYTFYGDDAAIPVLIDSQANLPAITHWWYAERERLFDERVSAESKQGQDCR